MRILAVDTSAKVTSVCVVDENGIIAEFNSNAKLTHSQALMPMVYNLFECAKLSLSDIDGFACAVGPGSFTGLRIGISAIKGLAYGEEKPCVGISTLDGLIYNLKGYNGIICAVMDARCNQVYTSTFCFDKNEMTRICDDSAMSIDELYLMLEKFKKDIFLVGDGADLCYNSLKTLLPNLFVASDSLKYQRAASIGFLSLEKFKNGNITSAQSLVPIYLRLPQAQRELMKKQKGEQNESRKQL